MPAKQFRRNPKRRVTNELETFCVTGNAERGSDLLWDIFADPSKIYEGWKAVKDRLRRTHKKLLAWTIFETRGAVDCFPQFCWITRDDYLKWKNEHE
jgi:hypothetical protein